MIKQYSVNAHDIDEDFSEITSTLQGEGKGDKSSMGN